MSFKKNGLNDKVLNDYLFNLKIKYNVIRTTGKLSGNHSIQ